MAQDASDTPVARTAIKPAHIIDIHAIARETLSEISAITKLVLCALEHPSTYYRQDELGKVIECIHFAAGGAVDTLAGEMEALGIVSPETAEERRRVAYSAHLQQTRS